MVPNWLVITVASIIFVMTAGCGTLQYSSTGQIVVAEDPEDFDDK